MKSLILNFFIVGCILENYVEGSREMKFFRDYALELVNAATIPFNGNVELRKLGSQCFPIVRNEDSLNPFSLILSIMSIAEEEQRRNVSYRTLIRNADDISEMQNQIPEETMILVRKIVRVLETTTEDFQLVPLNEVSAILNNHPLNPPYIAGLCERFHTDTTLDSLTKCHEALRSIYFNDRFFEKLFRGFSIELQLIKIKEYNEENDHEEALKSELETIVVEISEWPALPSADANFFSNEFDDFSLLLNQRYQMLLEEKMSVLKKRAIIFAAIVAVSFASSAVIQAAGVLW